MGRTRVRETHVFDPSRSAKEPIDAVQEGPVADQAGRGGCPPRKRKWGASASGHPRKRPRNGSETETPALRGPRLRGAPAPTAPARRRASPGSGAAEDGRPWLVSKSCCPAVGRTSQAQHAPLKRWEKQGGKRGPTLILTSAAGRSPGKTAEPVTCAQLRSGPRQHHSSTTEPPS